MTDLPRLDDVPVTVLGGRALKGRDRIIKVLNTIAGFRLDNVVQQMTIIHALPYRERMNRYRDHNDCLRKLVGQGMVHEDRANTHQAGSWTGQGPIPKATLLGCPLPILSLSGRPLDMHVYAAVQNLCLFMSDSYVTVIDFIVSLDQREKVNFIRNCSLALRVLAQESLIDNVHSTMFENWMDTHKVDIQRQAFWVDLWFQCRTLVK